MKTSFEFQSIDLKNIPDALAGPLNAHYNALRAERLPDDPPIPLDEDLAGWRNIPTMDVVDEWLVWDERGERIIVSAELETWLVEDNQNLGFFDISVLPEYRQRGLARQALKLVLDQATARGKNSLLTRTYDRVPAGILFLERMGGKRGLETHTNQLNLAELDRQLLADWLSLGTGLAERFELGWWGASYPESDIEAIVALWDIENDAPRDNLVIEREIITVDQIREWEHFNQARGNQRWSLYVKDRGSGRYAGITEMFYQPNRLHILNQGFTGVHPDFRGQGLGRWLKATMLQRVLDERPQVTLVRTGNANSNAPMLSINHKLGFKPYLASTLWQVGTQEIRDYLEK